MSKKFRDISNYTSPRDALQLFGASLREGLAYDAYGVQTDFRAIVLSRPVPISQTKDKISGFYNNGPPSGPSLFSKDEGPIARFVFKARILGTPSPHDFLPNPCNSTYAINGANALEIIGMHTKFVSPNDYRGDPPKIGDIVNIKLIANVFSYNLQEGEFVSLAARGDGLATEGVNLAECSINLNGLFSDKFDLGDPTLARDFGGGDCAAACKGASVKKAGETFDVKNPSTFKASAAIKGKKATTSRYGPRYSPTKGDCSCHRGVDYGARAETAVLSIADGKVYRAPTTGCPTMDCSHCDAVKAAAETPVRKCPTVDRGSAGCSCGSGYGNHVVIEHTEVMADGGKIFSIYAHLHPGSITLKSGDAVKKGGKLGGVGSTGSSTGPHLHMELHTGKLFGTYWDAQAFIDKYS